MAIGTMAARAYVAGARDERNQMSTPTVTENIVALEPVTRDNFADSPAPAPAETERLHVHRLVPAARRQTV